MFKIKTNLIAASLFFLLVSPLAVNAAGLIPCASYYNGTQNKPCTLCDFIVGFKNIVDFGMNLITIAAIVGIFFAGVMYVISSGNEAAMERAKGFLKSSLIGFALFFGAWLIIFIVMWVLSVKTDLGIGITSWNTFTCSTVSSSGQTGTSGNSTNNANNTNTTKFSCDTVDLNGNGIIDPGEGACNPNVNGTFNTVADCEKTCPTAATQRCGQNNAGACYPGATCPPSFTRITGTCSGSDTCCTPSS